MWTAHAHTAIQEVAENLWRIEAAMKRPPMRRAMDVIRRPDGTLWIHNAVAASEATMTALEAWGKPSVLLVPSGFHRIDPARFKERYPNIQIFTPKGALKRVRKKVAVDGTYDDLPAADDIAIEPLDGVADAEAAVRVASADGLSLLFCDAVFNMKHRAGFDGWVLKAIGSSGGPRVTRVFRFAVLKDKAAFKASLLRLAELPRLKRVLVQHEDALTPAELRSVAESL
jgi:hypothetical protein